MLDHNEKLKLVIEFIQSGTKDIIHSIKAIEKKLFKNNELRSLKKKITGNKGTGSYVLSKK